MIASPLSAEALVEVENLSMHYSVRGGFLRKRSIKAVENLSFSIRRGETLGLVGESGSGKSTLGRVIMNFLPKTAGRVRIDGREVGSLKSRQARTLWRQAQMVFQDPYASLNPSMTVRDTLAEPLRNFGIAQGARADVLVREALEECGLSASAMDLYPREFSGGQRQRIGIARALILRPAFIVADEPVSALDVSIQAQIINLFQDLQRSRGLTYLFIAHDLAVVRHIADRVAVMYQGRIIELAPANALYGKARHPYTSLLLRSVPIADPHAEAERLRQFRPFDDSTALTVKHGCPFRPRCPRAQLPLCGEVQPALAEIEAGHLVACHHPESDASASNTSN
jgi:oligopeptide/dipeptide ABC transporter ATP-binding protein